MADTMIRGLATAMIHTFFRRVRVDGLDRLPATGPVITVANHANGLVDGILLMSMLPRWPRFLGKATLFKIAPLKPFLNLAGVIPVYRAKDAKPGTQKYTAQKYTAQNDETFAECRRLLAEGAMVAIFPEGISHDFETLQPLRTGAARIAITAATQGANELSIVPIGLAYDAKATFRSHAVISIGDPIPVSRWVGQADERAAVRECTDAITAGLLAVSPDNASMPLPTAVTHRLRFTSVAKKLSSAKPRAVLVLATPVALVGAIIHAVPYQIVKRAARLPKNDSIRSTVKLLGCTALFVIEWLSIGAVAWRKRGPLTAAVAVVACPVSGYVAVRFAETVRDASASDGQAARYTLR